MATQKVKIKIVPRQHFRGYIESAKRWAVLVAHRRAGKTVAVVQKLLRCALTHKRQGPPLRYGYIAPTRDQAKDIAWGYLKAYAGKIPGSQINESELRVTLFNGAVIRLYSGENYERMRGLYFDGIVSDEDADIPPEAFDYVILPCLLDYDGWHTRIGTPKGKNAFYRSFQDAKTDEDSFALMLKASESGILSESALKAMKAKLTDEAYRQEMECDFNVGRPGAIYAEAIQRAESEGRILQSLPAVPALVNTSWDLGAPQNTPVWFWRIVGREIHVIDYDIGQIGETLVDRVARILGKGYPLGAHYFPHDAAQTERTGQTFAGAAKEAGLENIRVVPVTRDVWVGINALLGLFPSLVFLEPKTRLGLDALEAYHTKEVTTSGIVCNEPVHDWASHPSDALRTMAEAVHCGMVKVSAMVEDKDDWEDRRRRRRGPQRARMAVGG